MEITTPGRICLFGEHQDYLGLPVIAMAISLRMKIKGYQRSDRKVIIHKKDLMETESFSLNELKYKTSRDYFKSGIKVCLDEGLVFSSGFECEITSEIPIQAGTSSSSAMVVSWIHFLSSMAEKEMNWTPKKLGELAFKAEVLEFSEPGGMMDQYSTAIGNLIYLESDPIVNVEQLNPKLGSFILGDSGEPKNTKKILKRCKDSRIEIIQNVKSKNKNFNLNYSCEKDLDLSLLNDKEKDLFFSTIENRDILKRAKIELEKKTPDHKVIGLLINEQHAILRDKLKVSTEKIESMLTAALNAGALGGKINGSGGGGCMFAYAPENQELVALAIESVGGKAYIVHPDNGTQVLT